MTNLRMGKVDRKHPWVLRPGAEEKMVICLARGTCQGGPGFLGVGFLPGVLRLKEAPPHCLAERGRYLFSVAGCGVGSIKATELPEAISKRRGEAHVQGDVSAGCPATVRTHKGIQAQGESR